LGEMGCLHLHDSIIELNIKENYYIYQFKQLNELILVEEQKSIQENGSQNSNVIYMGSRG
jgi:hypothetical protein